MVLIQNLKYQEVISKLADMHACTCSAEGWFTIQFETNGMGQEIVLRFICVCINMFKYLSGLKKPKRLCEE